MHRTSARRAVGMRFLMPTGFPLPPATPMHVTEDNVCTGQGAAEDVLQLDVHLHHLSVSARKD